MNQPFSEEGEGGREGGGVDNKPVTHSLFQQVEYAAAMAAADLITAGHRVCLSALVRSGTETVRERQEAGEARQGGAHQKQGIHSRLPLRSRLEARSVVARRRPPPVGH